MRRFMLLGLAVVAVLGMEWRVKAQAETAQVGLGVQFTLASCGASNAAIVGSVAADGITVGLFLPYSVPGTSTAGWSHIASVTHDGRPACQRRLGTWHFLSEE